MENEADKSQVAVGNESKALVARVQGIRWTAVVFSVTSATFLYSLDNTLLADVQAAVVERFDATKLTPWCSIAYILCGTALILPWTTFFKIFNCKTLFIISISLFEVGSAICGAAPSMTAFILGRAIAGTGGTGIYIGVTTMLSVTTTDHERPTYMSLIGLGWAIGTVLGPLVGGAFTESSATWRWGFYINLCIGGLLSPIYIFWLPDYHPQATLSLADKWKKVDILGTILSVGGLVSGIMGILFGGVLYPWSDARIIAMLVLSVFLLVLFFVTQELCLFTTAKDRIFPMEFLRSRSMILLGLLVACASTALYVPVFYLPLLFQFANSDSPIHAAVRLLPLVSMGVFFCFLNGGIMPKNGYYAPWYVLGSVLVTIGGALMYKMKIDTSPSKIYGYTILIGAGVGMYYLAGFSVAQVKAGSARIVTTTGYMTLMQWCGVVSGVAISGAIFTNKAMSELSTLLPMLPPEQISAALAGTDSTVLTSLPSELREEALVKIIDALETVYILVLIAGALGLVLSCFLRFEKLFLVAAVAG